MTGEPLAAADANQGADTAAPAVTVSEPSLHADGAASVKPNPLQARVRRTVLACVAILVLCVPFVVFALINHEVAASSWAALAGLTALVNYVLGGRAVAYLTVGLLTALTPIALVVGAVPVAGAGLMAIMCGGVGVSAAWGLHRGMMLVPLFLACVMIAPPVWGSVPVDRNATDYLVWSMVIWGGGALWAALVFPPLLRKMKPIPREPNSRGDTIAYTATITVLCTLSTLAVLIWQPGSNGAWLIVTLLVITQVGQVDTLKSTTTRVARNHRRRRRGSRGGIPDDQPNRADRHRSGADGDRPGDQNRTELLAVHGVHDPGDRAVQLHQRRRRRHHR